MIHVLKVKLNNYDENSNDSIIIAASTSYERICNISQEFKNTIHFGPTAMVNFCIKNKTIYEPTNTLFVNPDEESDP